MSEIENRQFFNTDIAGYNYKNDPRVVAAADACGAVWNPCGGYDADATKAGPLRDVLNAIREAAARKSRGQITRGNPYEEFSSSDNDDGERNH